MATTLPQVEFVRLELGNTHTHTHTLCTFTRRAVNQLDIKTNYISLSKSLIFIQTDDKCI